MTDERRRRAEEIFQAAADRDEAERPAFLDAACAGDPRLRAEVQSLLAHLDLAGEDFLARPAFDPSVSRELEVPARIGHYRIVDRLGEGGMGVVFEAEQDSPRRRVALKVIRPGLHGPDVRRRFEFEAEILARLHHPCIAHVYDAGVIEIGRGEGLAVPLPYFAMELVRGPSIDRFVRERGTSSREVVELVAKVADAVESAHQRGVIHRDLKPANVVVDPSGSPKVLDFGLARAVDDGATRSLHTGTGTILGTLPYISPEQLGGDPKDVDTRTDVYSLGVILLELLIGEPPVDVAALPLPEAIRRLREEPLPRPSRSKGRVDEELDTIVQRATARDRERRYPSAGALAADLRRYLENEPIEAKRDSAWYLVRKQARRHRRAVAAGATFLLLLVVASVVGFSLYVRAEQARSLAMEQLWSTQLQQARATRESGTVGRRLRSLETIAAAARLRADRTLRDEAIASMALDDLALETVVSYEGRSAGGRGLAHFDRVAIALDDGRVRIRRLDGEAFDLPRVGEARLLMDTHQFSPDGHWLLVRHVDGGIAEFRLWDLERRELVRSFDDDEVSGRAFVFVHMPGGEDRLLAARPSGGLMSIDPATGSVILSVESPPDPVRLAIDPAGGTIALSFRGTADVRIHRVTDLHSIGRIEQPVDAYGLTFSDDGAHLVTGGMDAVVRVFRVADGRLVHAMAGHQSVVVELGAVAGSDLVVSSSWDQTVRFWDVERGVEVFAPMPSVELSSTSDRLVIKHPDQYLQVWRYVAGGERVVLRSETDLGAPTGGTMDEHGDHLLVAGATGVREWDVARRKVTRVFTGVRARDVILDRDRRHLLATTDLGLLRIDLHDEDAAAPPEVLSSEWFEQVALHPEGFLVAGRGKLVVFDEQGERRRLPAPMGASSVDVSPDGRWSFVGTWRGDPARVIENATGRAVRQFAGLHLRGAFDASSSRLAVSDGEQVQILDTSTWEVQHRIPRGFSGNSLAGPVAFSSRGDLFLLAVDQYRLELLETRRFTPLLSFANPEFTVISAAGFSDDDSHVFALGTGRRVVVWELHLLRERLRSLGLDWTDAPESDSGR